MAKASKKANETTITTPAVVAAPEATTPETVTLTLPKGSKVTTSKQTIITPAVAETGNKERWFETKKLVSYQVGEDKLISITILKSQLAYRGMLND